MKSEKNQQDRVNNTQLVFHWVLLISKKNYANAADLSNQKALDADSRAIQQLIFTISENVGAMIYYFLQRSKETIRQFSEGKTKFL